MASEPIDILERAVTQLGRVIDRVRPDQLDGPTPCRSWDVATLLDHILGDLPPFIEAARGGTADWAAQRPSVAPEWAAVFHIRADELMAAWRDPARDSADDADGADSHLDAQNLQISEISVHTWDLAAALGLTGSSTRRSPNTRPSGWATPCCRSIAAPRTMARCSGRSSSWHPTHPHIIGSPRSPVATRTGPAPDLPRLMPRPKTGTLSGDRR